MSIVFSDARSQENSAEDNQNDDHSAGYQTRVVGSLDGIRNLKAPTWGRRDFLRQREDRSAGKFEE